MNFIINALKKIIVFNEPKDEKTFTLKEKSIETNNTKSTKFKNITHGKEDTNQQTNNELEDYSNGVIGVNLSQNLESIKKIYNIPYNSDIVIRNFTININKNELEAFIILIDGLVNTKVVDDNILQPLMLLSNIDIKDDDKSITNYIENHLITHNQTKKTKKFADVIDEVNFGACGIFIDGIDVAFIADVKGWQGRTVGRPNNEIIIRGPQEGFTENIRTNTGLVRKILKDKNLIIENIPIGKRSKTPTAILYIKDIVNDSLVEEVRRRLKRIKIDNIIDTGELEQLIEDASFLPIPQTIDTERPDRVASMLIEGKVAILMNGSPFALVVPSTLPELLHSPEDSYIRFPYVNLLRLLRLFGIVMALLLPGIYVAITSYHHEMIPTNLLLSIVASREKVPFPIIIELLIMEISFELIREAGIRIPGPIGPTLGIIGGLILGQAAVSANIVSPIMIIIVALTGIGSFSIPNFSLGFAFRILKFGYILLGAVAGFFGIAIGLFIQGLWFLNAKSFGVPMLSPISPVTSLIFLNDLTRAPIWKQEKRPDFLNTKKVRKQEKISREWDSQEKRDGANDE